MNQHDNKIASSTLCEKPVLPPAIRWRMARSELLYGKIVRLHWRELTEPRGLALISQVAKLWRKLFVDDAGAPTSTKTPTLYYLDKVDAQVARFKSDQTDSNTGGLEHDLRQIHFGVESAIAQMLAIKPGDVLICAKQTHGGIEYQPWRIEGIDDLRVLINAHQHNEIRHLGVAWAFHPRNSVAVPPGDCRRYCQPFPCLDTHTTSCQAVANDLPMTMTLSQHCNGELLYGWIDWEIKTDSQVFDISLSNVYSPLDDIWLWFMLIGLGCLPIAVCIDTEASVVVLRAAWVDEKADTLLISIHEGYHDSVEVPIARIGRSHWLANAAQTFGNFFDNFYIAKLWDYENERIDRPEALPWALPQHLMTREPSILPYHQELALALLQIARWFSDKRAGNDLTDIPSIGQHYWYCQRWALILGVFAYLTSQGKSPHELRWLDQFLNDLPDKIGSVVCHAFDAMVKFDAEWQSHDPRMAYRRPSDTDMFIATHKALAAIANDVVSALPFFKGMWLVAANHWGQLLAWDEDMITIDWGEHGISNQLLCSTWIHFRQLPEPLPVVVDTPLLQRWRRFATDENSDIYPICPCCGYPCWELDWDEIQFCLYCGWFCDHGYRLQELDAVNQWGDRDYTLRQARQNFETHGDAFDLNDTSTDAQLHRHLEIVAAKRQVIYAMEQWLATEPNSTELPFREWSVLDDLIWSVESGKD